LGSIASACVAFNGIFVPIKLQIVMIDVGQLMVYSSSVLEDCSGAEEAKAMGCWMVLPLPRLFTTWSAWQIVQ
jgi:hypothetical protein